MPIKPIQYANCDCVDKVNASLESNPKNEFCLATSIFIWSDSGVKCESIVLGFNRIKSDKFVKSGLRPNYCPFCGESYKTEAQMEALKMEASDF